MLISPPKGFDRMLYHKHRGRENDAYLQNDASAELLVVVDHQIFLSPVNSFHTTRLEEQPVCCQLILQR